MILHEDVVDLPTPTGPMRTYILHPVAPGQYPGILFYSEIYQVTSPVRRTAAMLAGNGFVVAVPEVYHELEPPGTVLAYDQAGTDRGNAPTMPPQRFLTPKISPILSERCAL